MLDEPPDGLGQSCRERPCGFPTDAAADLAAVHRVALHVTRAIRYPADETSRLPDRVHNRLCDLEGGLPLPGPDVERLPFDAVPAKDREERLGVVVYVDPLPAVPATSVHGQRMSDEGADREQGNRLLRMLVRPVVVHAPCDDNGQIVCRVVRVREAGGPRLGCGVRTLRPERRVLAARPRTPLPK